MISVMPLQVFDHSLKHLAEEMDAHMAHFGGKVFHYITAAQKLAIRIKWPVAEKDSLGSPTSKTDMAKYSVKP